MKILHTILILFFCIIISDDLKAQTGTIKIAKPKPAKQMPVKDSTLKDPSNVDFYYGYKCFVSDFQGKFNTVQHFNFSQPIQLIGVGVSGPVIYSMSSRTYYSHILYTQVIPQPLFINDTIKCKVTGGILNVAWGGFFRSQSKKFYFNYYVGFNTGRLRFYGDEIVRQKNPFFSPKLGIQPKISIGRFNISVLVEAEYDVSKTSWRRMTNSNKDKINIDKFRQTGITTLVGMSYRLLRYGSGDKGNSNTLY